MRRKNYSVIIPGDTNSLPTERELSAARILADYFQCNVFCIACSNRKTPDFRIRGILWELKTPMGTGKHNIQHLLHAAIQQSGCIVVDARFSKMHMSRIKSELKHHTQVTTKGIKRLLLIDKSGLVLEIV